MCLFLNVDMNAEVVITRTDNVKISPYRREFREGVCEPKQIDSSEYCLVNKCETTSSNIVFEIPSYFVLQLLFLVQLELFSKLSVLLKRLLRTVTI